MSYCVNCGVELDASAKKCPLCDTPVYNPKAPEPEKQPSPFPREKGQVEVVKRKDLGVLLTVIVLATAVTWRQVSVDMTKTRVSQTRSRSLTPPRSPPAAAKGLPAWGKAPAILPPNLP